MPEEEPRPGWIVIPAGFTDPVKPHELSTAFRLAAAGHMVEFLVPSNEPGMKTPDILLDGRLAEMKSPLGRGKTTIANQFRRARHQADLLVLDAVRTPLEDADVVAQVLRRMAGMGEFAEVLIMTKTGDIVQVTR